VFDEQPGLWRSLTIDPATQPEGCRPRAWLSAKLALLQRVGWAVECFNLRPGAPLGGADLAGALRCLTPMAARSVWLLSEQAPGDASWAALACLSQLTELDVRCSSLPPAAVALLPQLPHLASLLWVSDSAFQEGLFDAIAQLADLTLMQEQGGAGGGWEPPLPTFPALQAFKFDCRASSRWVGTNGVLLVLLLLLLLLLLWPSLRLLLILRQGRPGISPGFLCKFWPPVNACNRRTADPSTRLRCLPISPRTHPVQVAGMQLPGCELSLRERPRGQPPWRVLHLSVLRRPTVLHLLLQALLSASAAA
jgi:hypothetical protein